MFKIFLLQNEKIFNVLPLGEAQRHYSKCTIYTDLRGPSPLPLQIKLTILVLHWVKPSCQNWTKLFLVLTLGEAQKFFFIHTLSKAQLIYYYINLHSYLFITVFHWRKVALKSHEEVTISSHGFKLFKCTWVKVIWIQTSFLKDLWAILNIYKHIHLNYETVWAHRNSGILRNDDFRGNDLNG